MMKNLSKCMLVGLLAVNGCLNGMGDGAGAPVGAGLGAGAGVPGAAAGVGAGARAVGNAPAGAREGGPAGYFSGGLNKGIEQLGTAVVVGSVGYLLTKGGEWAKVKYFGDTKDTKQSEAEALERDLKNNAAEIKMESDKIGIALAEGDSLSKPYQTYVLIYNGGVNTGIDKKEIQAEIRRVVTAIKNNSEQCKLVTLAANERIKELEQKRKEIIEQAAAKKALKLSQADFSFSFAKRSATPELAANLLARSANRGA